MANNIYLSEAAVKVFKSSAGDVVWTPTSVAAGNGRISDVLDLGAAPRPFEFNWRLKTKFVSATVGHAVRLYLVELETNAVTYQDGGGGLGTADATLTSESLLLYGGKQIGPTVVQHTTNANGWSGICRIHSRYVQVALWNGTAVALSGTASDHEFRLTPIFRQVQ